MYLLQANQYIRMLNVAALHCAQGMCCKIFFSLNERIYILSKFIPI